jgi:ABC-type Na+ efflux pump permease subunit
MRRREIIAAALSFFRTSLSLTSTVSSVANNLVAELETDVFEMLLSTRSSGELSSGASPMIREP